MEWMFLPLKRYAEFSGRSRRKEYWMFALFNFLVLCVFGLLAALGGGDGGLTMTALGLVVVYALALFIPGLAVQVRRFHDQDRTGWWVLLGLVPYLGGLVILVFMMFEGTRGANEYGPDPKADESVSITA